MRVFCDCKFVERGRDLPMQLVSIGLVREDGVELYAINEECLSNVMKHPWLSVNVAPLLPIGVDSAFIYGWDKEHGEYGSVLALDQLIEYVRRFFFDTDDAELWAYYGAYGHVVLRQLFGSMGELPAGIPMFTHDLKQLHEQHPLVVLPPEKGQVHHALDDARWVRDAYDRIIWSQVADVVDPREAHSPRELTYDIPIAPVDQEDEPSSNAQ